MNQGKEKEEKILRNKKLKKKKNKQFYKVMSSLSYGIKLIFVGGVLESTFLAEWQKCAKIYDGHL